MKFTHEVTINLPLARVVELMDGPENLKHWQPELVSFEHFSGTRGQPGAKSKLTYDMNGRKFVMIETINVRNLPHEFSGTYEVNGMLHAISNHFIPVDERTTKMVSDNDIHFTGFMKIVGLLMRGSIMKQTTKYMDNFKSFAETGIPVPKS